jgi:uncharacterized membrane protein
MDHFDPKLKVILSFIIPSILFVILSIPLILKKVPPNGIYGFRLKKTMSNGEIWYKANRFGGAALLVAASVTSMSCAVLFFKRESFYFDDLNNIAFLFFLGPLLVALCLTLLYIKRL